MRSIHCRCSSAVSVRTSDDQLDSLVDSLFGGEERRCLGGCVLHHRDDVGKRLVMGQLKCALKIGFGEVLRVPETALL